jgi:hypothetical protein
MEQDARGSRVQDKTTFRGGPHAERSMPRDYAVYSQFFAKVKLYYQLKDHAWDNFPTLSKSEMDDLDKRIQLLRDEIGAIIHNNKEIGILVQKARESKSPDVLLRKIHDDLLD